MKINIEKISDGLNGNWWHHISSDNFGFQQKIPDLANHNVKKDDILIHKETENGERYPAIKYSIITSSLTKSASNTDVKDLLAKKLVSFVQKNKKLPYSCVVAKFFKNGSVQVNYKPTDYDNFALKIVPKVHGVKDTKEFFDNLDAAEKNPVASGTKKGEGGSRRIWQIPSSSDPTKTYTVTNSGGSWSCTCPQYRFRKRICKHIKQCM
ncbi:MAG: SWIM zinc finger family protein [Promethearchaeota archaeon]